MLVPQSCPTFCNPMDCGPPGSSVHRILQARILKWVVFSFSRRSLQSRDWNCVFFISRKILYHVSHQGSPCLTLPQYFIFNLRRKGARRKPHVHREVSMLGAMLVNWILMMTQWFRDNNPYFTDEETITYLPDGKEIPELKFIRF